jgi:hypothetical protein
VNGLPTTTRAALEANARYLFEQAKRANDPETRDPLSRDALDLAVAAEKCNARPAS